jgi:hypothetical protein
MTAIKIPSQTALVASTAVGPIHQARLKALTEKANEALKLTRRIAELEGELEVKSAELRKLVTETIPGMMEEAGCNLIGLKDGWQIEVTPIVIANIKNENKPAAFKWLRANKYGSLIKNTIDIAFGMGQDKTAKAVAAFLKKSKVPFEQKESIHKGTLTAFVKEHLAKQADPEVKKKPPELPPVIDVVRLPTAIISKRKK